MQPDVECLKFLQSTNIMRNYDCQHFLQANNNEINIEKYMCYAIGNIEGKRIVHSFRILARSSGTKNKCYKIEWFNTAMSPTWHFNQYFDSVSFWVHSALVLRKVFFLYEDRMSLYRSTFIYDENSGTFFRLCSILQYLIIPSLCIYNCQIYTSPNEYFYCHIRAKENNKTIKKTPQLLELQKQLKRIISKNQNNYYLKTHHQQLSIEIDKFIKL